MNRDEIYDLAKKREACAQTMKALGMQNAYGATPEEQVTAAARYRLAQDAFAKADRDYNNAISSLGADELSALVRQV